MSVTTIAGFLQGARDKSIDLGLGSLIVIDEASMIDVSTMYRSCDRCSRAAVCFSSATRGQLPPIGFGTVLHVLASAIAVARVELFAAVAARRPNNDRSPWMIASGAGSALSFLGPTHSLRRDLFRRRVMPEGDTTPSTANEPELTESGLPTRLVQNQQAGSEAWS